MSRIKISADSTCDLSPELLTRFDVNIVPLFIESDDGKTYRDGVDLTRDDMFDLIENKGINCRTTAVNAFAYSEIFRELLKDADAVIHISLSSHMSACFQNALSAANEMENVYVIDSKNLSSASGHLVCEAGIMAQRGVEAADIAKELDSLANKLEASFVIDTLDYLKRGGRCSALKAFSAAVLKIKPCIDVIDGKMTVGTTYRGSLDTCLKRYVKQRLTDRDDIDSRRLFITHSGCAAEVVAMVREQVEKYAQFDEIDITEAGCTISAHCGPNTLGILFFRK